MCLLPLTGLSDELPATQSSELDEKSKATVKPQRKPVYIEADNISGYYKQEVEASGNAELRHGNDILVADRMKYFQKTEETEVEGNIYLDRVKEIITGDHLKLNLQTNEGHMSDPKYYIKTGKGRGAGEILFFEGKDQYRIEKTNYTTCPEGNHDWYIRASSLKIDHNNEVGTARNVSIVFKNTPILYSPWLDFSYSGKRKTGLLTPLLGYNVHTGFDTALPIYLNIAPNIDATVAPRVMTMRGFMLSNELRYMGEKMYGNLLFDILPMDINTNKTRWGVLFTHTQNFGRGWQGILNYNRVSDDQYFRELTPNLSQTSLTNLSQMAATSYNGRLGLDGTISFDALVQRFQTIQDRIPLFTSPYARLPYLSLAANKPSFGGLLEFGLNSSWGNFEHHAIRTVESTKFLPDGQRFVINPHVSMPLQNEYGFIKPKIGFHYTHYSLSHPVQGYENRGTNHDRALPIFSVDSGTTFERPTQMSGIKFTQTLEPRLFYAYIPYSNQKYLPVFDSAINDFNFAQILQENRFSGSDRINDANRLTAALTTRFVEQETGIERLRLAVGQVFNFNDPKVKFLEPQVTSGKSDFVAAISGRLTPQLSTDANIQMHEKGLEIQKVRSGLSYQPEPGKVLNFGYRFTRHVLEQVDSSIQWPIIPNLHGVARINYSLRDDRVLAGLAGIEYNSCCWALRLVMQRITTATQTTTTAFFVQLELKGLMGIGNNPLQVLQSTIPGYTSIY
ncbi:LPS-assembly protein LptD [Nitrosomonas sp. PY1]|uniref:LPS-assembly protein LptD n=1 Tax=Nitrosomonas sp. PY1 TaxID=1803906 RepID=UPI001FC8A37F|nr:LPS-assembly protein LptD [Nitrosomonas sp. PY1]